MNTPLRRSGMAHVLKGSHSFTCTPRVHPLSEWTISAFAFPAKAGTHLPTPEGWKAELALRMRIVHNHGPAAGKLLSLSCNWVLGTRRVQIHRDCPKIIIRSFVNVVFVVNRFIWGRHRTSVHVLFVSPVYECHCACSWRRSHGRLCERCSGESRFTLSPWHW